jgi:DNA polymerase III subunit gamma/tau
LDLDEIREKLSQLLSSGNIPHAFLFAGPKGLGKTSAARILAKAINCTNNKGKKSAFEPCNKCSVCKSITKGSFLDLIEIDAASNRGIDDIRNLKDKIKLSPSEAAKKVYVIDEVHMLTTEAFNALLKTLEEPPGHAVFILCTTEAHKLPETIKSRCLRFDFRKPTLKEIQRPLKRIAKAEKLKVSDKVIGLIASHADDSFRDAVKILEQLSFTGKIISQKQADNFFKHSRVKSQDFIKSLALGDIRQSLGLLDQANSFSIDLKTFILEVLTDLRKIILSKFKIIDDDIKDYNLSINQLKKLISIFNKAGMEIKNSVLPQIPLEMAILKWREYLNRDGAEIKPGKPGREKSKVREILKDADSLLQQKWPEILKNIKEVNHSIEALLKAARPVKKQKDQFFIQVFYPFHKQKLEIKDNLQVVEKQLKKVLGKKYQVKYILKPKQGKQKN